MKIYIIEYLEEGMDFMFQTHSVTSSEEYAITLSSMLQDRDDIIQAGYTEWGVVIPDEV